MQKISKTALFLLPLLCAAMPTPAQVPEIRKLYYESGALKEEASFKGSQLEGLMKGYYESGALKDEIPFKNDKIEGMMKTYHENGKLASEIYYKNDKKDGYAHFYDENGYLMRRVYYKWDSIVSATYWKEGDPQNKEDYEPPSTTSMFETFEFDPTSERPKVKEIILLEKGE